MLLTFDSPALTMSFDASPECIVAVVCLLIAALLVKLVLTTLAFADRWS